MAYLYLWCSKVKNKELKIYAMHAMRSNHNICSSIDRMFWGIADIQRRTKL